jgi:hypothetical protein
MINETLRVDQRHAIAVTTGGRSPDPDLPFTLNVYLDSGAVITFGVEDITTANEAAEKISARWPRPRRPKPHWWNR